MSQEAARGTAVLDTAARWAGVARAGAEALTPAGARALVDAATQGRQARLLLVFASSRLDPARLAAVLTGAAEGVPVVGATTAGEIALGGPGRDGVVLTALGGPGLDVQVRLARHAGADLRGAGSTAGSGCESLGSGHPLVVLLADGLVGDLRDVVRGAYDVAGAAVPLVGGCAGDDGAMRRTHVIADGGAHTDAVVGIALSCPRPWGIGVAHGWRRVGRPMLVTASEGTEVLELDELPALDAYLRHLDAPVGLAEDPAAFGRWAALHPLGMNGRTGDVARFIAGGDPTRRSLRCIASVPVGSLVWLMEGDPATVLEATRAACNQAVAALGGPPPVALLAFDCIARHGVLGDAGAVDEVELITAAARGAAVAGFYTYGEIARTGGPGGFHNQTLVVLAVP